MKAKIIKVSLLFVIATGVNISAYVYFDSQRLAEQEAYRAELVSDRLNNISRAVASGLQSLNQEFDIHMERIQFSEGALSGWKSLDSQSLPVIQMIAARRSLATKDDTLSPPISWGDLRLIRSLDQDSSAKTESFVFENNVYLRRAALVPNSEEETIVVGTWRADILNEVLKAYEGDGRVSLLRLLSGASPVVVYDEGHGALEPVTKSIGSDWLVRYYPSDQFLNRSPLVPLSFTKLTATVAGVYVFFALLAVLVWRHRGKAADRHSSTNKGFNTNVQAESSASANMPHHVFRDYDIRGEATELESDFCENVGKAMGTLVLNAGGEGLYVARDGRESSPRIHKALIKGLVSTGVKVIDVGVGHSGLLYFATSVGQFNSGVMITASHNPKDYNGFKTVVAGKVLDGAKVREIKSLIASQRYKIGEGGVEQVDISDRYLEAVNICNADEFKLKIVVDAGNGVAGPMAIKALEQAGCDVIGLYCDIDGQFPNHEPDPSDIRNLDDLRQAVVDHNADIGVALDGDGDRLFLVDEQGAIVLPDAIMMILGKDICSRNDRTKVIYDIKSSLQIPDYISRFGGEGIVCKSGHSNIRNKMLAESALLGGELSGHIFIKDDWYGFDDGIYAALRILKVLKSRQESLGAVLSYLPTTCATPEIRVSVPSSLAEDTISKLKDASVWPVDAQFLLVDGIRVALSNGAWGLVRSSNTETALTFRFEASNEEDLIQIRQSFFDILNDVAVEVDWTEIIEDRR